MPIISTFAATPVESTPRPMKNPPLKAEADADEEAMNVSGECRELLRRLPREKGWRTRYLYFFQSRFWCQPQEIQAIAAFQTHFRARHGDIFLTTIPKSGTTWLKALTFSVINRRRFTPSSGSHPLITANPHDLVPFLEYKLYAAADHLPEIDSLSSGGRRVFGTQVPYSAMSDTTTTATTTNTKINYATDYLLDLDSPSSGRKVSATPYTALPDTTAATTNKKNIYSCNHRSDLDSSNSARRLFATHVPYSALPDTITTAVTNTKIIYLCRNPLDTFISSWHYVTKLSRKSGPPPLSVADAFEMYCKGVVGFGPFWDHMLGYWNQSLNQPNKVLFLKYEDMKDDISTSLKAMAAFIGVPFTDEEVQEGVVEDIARLCSFEKLKDLDVNKKGKSIKDFENRHLFRKGQVGDWVNYLSPAMAQQLKQIMDQKFGGSGLQFKLI